MSIFETPSTIFGGNTGMSYEDIQRKRQIANQLMLSNRAPRNVGEGLTAIGNALAVRGMNKRADRADKENREKWESKWSSLGGGGGGGFAGGGGTYTPPEPPNPNDAMYPTGETGPAPQGNVDPESGLNMGVPQASNAGPFTGGKQEFIQAMMPHAMRVSEQTGLDPRVVIAQAAQETGWGKSAPGNNYFGIKSHGKKGGNNFATNEVINGETVRINDSFRGYKDMGDSVDGYAEFLQTNPRYRNMLSAPDLEGQIAALGESGYATDPNYANSVGSIARSINLPNGSFAPGQGTQVAQAGGGGGGYNMMALAEMLGAPDAYVSPGRKAIISQLLNQQMQANDPAYQLDMQMKRAKLAEMQNPTVDPMDAVALEQAKLDLEQDRNPTVEPTTLQKNYNAAKEQGYEGTIFDYQNDLKKAGASNTTVRLGEEAGKYSYGTKAGLPVGWRVDNETGVASPIPGSPAEMEVAEAADAADVASGNSETSTDIVTTAAGFARDADEARIATGLFGTLAAINPGSENAEINRQLDVLKGLAKTSNLQAMKVASKTGGALGAVSEGELAMLGQMSGALDPASPNFARDLDNYERVLLRTIHGPQAGDAMYEQTRKTPPETTKEPVMTFEQFSADPRVQAVLKSSGLTIDELWAAEEDRRKGLE